MIDLHMMISHEKIYLVLEDIGCRYYITINVILINVNYMS